MAKETFKEQAKDLVLKYTRYDRTDTEMPIVSQNKTYIEHILNDIGNGK